MRIYRMFYKLWHTDLERIIGKDIFQPETAISSAWRRFRFSVQQTAWFEMVYKVYYSVPIAIKHMQQWITQISRTTSCFIWSEYSSTHNQSWIACYSENKEIGFFSLKPSPALVIAISILKLINLLVQNTAIELCLTKIYNLRILINKHNIEL